MSHILIDKELCTRCNTCATVCVTQIIDKSTGEGYPSLTEEKAVYCIKCGHCESFCAQKALTLDFLPEERINVTSTDGLIEPQDLTLYIQKRRSIRHFSSKTVSKELIAKIIDVARYAASGGNSQPVKMAADDYKPLMDYLSIPEGRKAACPMMLGYSRYKIASIPRRNPVDVTWK